MNPPDPPRLLPGRSARRYLWISGSCVVSGAPTVIMIVLGAGLPTPEREWVILGLVLVALGLGVNGGWASSRSNAAARSERRAGYTTLYGMYRELWQLDDRTGEVLRRLGERDVRRRPRGDA